MVLSQLHVLLNYLKRTSHHNLANLGCTRRQEMLEVYAHPVVTRVALQHRFTVLVGQPKYRRTRHGRRHAGPQAPELAYLAGISHKVSRIAGRLESRLDRVHGEEGQLDRHTCDYARRDGHEKLPQWVGLHRHLKVCFFEL